MAHDYDILRASRKSGVSACWVPVADGPKWDKVAERVAMLLHWRRHKEINGGEERGISEGRLGTYAKGCRRAGGRRTGNACRDVYGEIGILFA
jgi:hypothetical protein